MARFFTGQVVLVYLDDGQGSTKERPAIIISPEDECLDPDTLYVLAISTRIETPCPSYHILVHDSHATDLRTGLSSPCVAKCNWVRDLPARRVIRTLGALPDNMLETVITVFDQLQADDDFDGWQ